jgi:RNA polymerase sigma-70 factor (ECF subfamily)
MPDSNPAEESQVRLLRRIAAKDRQALAEFYDQVAVPLFSTATRILGDAHEAEEVVQDVFVQFWEKSATFDAALGSPLHWALRITRNRAIDRLRARQRRAKLAAQFQENFEAVAGGPSAVPTAGLDAEAVVQIRSIVGHLPADQRQAIEMAFFGGLTHTEIAETLGEPLGTVKARIRRGMLKLRESLQGYL